jgi:hypothetical protein
MIKQTKEKTIELLKKEIEENPGSDEDGYPHALNEIALLSAIEDGAGYEELMEEGFSDILDCLYCKEEKAKERDCMVCTELRHVPPTGI